MAGKGRIALHILILMVTHANRVPKVERKKKQNVKKSLHDLADMGGWYIDSFHDYRWPSQRIIPHKRISEMEGERFYWNKDIMEKVSRHSVQDINLRWRF